MKVLIIEDHPIVISGCRSLLSEDPDIELLEARTGREGRELFAAHDPDVTVIDVNLPDASGLELTREFIAAQPKARILIFTMSDAPVIAVQAIQYGALGYVSKNGDPSGVRDAIYELARGGKWLPDDLMRHMALSRLRAPGREGPVALSTRELTVLRALVRGRSMSEIAGDINVSYKTVASDCATIRQKLHARTQSEMARIAVELRLV